MEQRLLPPGWLPDEDTCRLVPRAYIAEYRVLPLELNENVLRLGVSSMSAEVLDELSMVTGLELLPVLTSDLENHISAYLSSLDRREMEKFNQALRRRLANAWLDGAQEFHFEPQQKWIRVRHRLQDGQLVEVEPSISKFCESQFVTALKELAGIPLDQAKPEPKTFEWDYEGRTFRLTATLEETDDLPKWVLRFH